MSAMGWVSRQMERRAELADGNCRHSQRLQWHRSKSCSASRASARPTRSVQGPVQFPSTEAAPITPKARFDTIQVTLTQTTVGQRKFRWLVQPTALPLLHIVDKPGCSTFRICPYHHKSVKIVPFYEPPSAVLSPVIA